MRFLGLGFVVLLCACTTDLTRFPVVVTVATDEGEPMPGLPVAVSGAGSRVTDPQGRVRMRIEGREGTQLTIAVAAPRGYRVDPATTQVVLRRLVRVDGRSRHILPLEQTVRLIPVERKYAILVRAGIAGLPIEAFGLAKGVTNSAGVAMFTYVGTPGDELKVRISTVDHPELRPQNPLSTVVLGAKSDAYVVKEKFAAPVRRRPTRIHRIRRL